MSDVQASSTETRIHASVVASQGTRTTYLRVTLWSCTFAAVVFGALVPAWRIAGAVGDGWFTASQDYDESLTAGALTLLVPAGVILVRHFSDRMRRWTGGAEFAAGVILFVIAANAGGFHIQRVYRGAVLEAVARAERVAQAIQAFERARGRPPDALDDLVPEFAEGPDPAALFGLLPMLEYLSSSPADGPRAGTWQLRPCRLMTSVSLEYLPEPGARPPWPGERRVGNWLVDAAYLPPAGVSPR